MTKHLHLHFHDSKPSLKTHMVRDKNGRPHYMVTCDKQFVGRITPDGINYKGHHRGTDKWFTGKSISDCLSQMQSHHNIHG